jgi:hypothetical protein
VTGMGHEDLRLPLDKAAESEEIKSIRVWGTVGNKTDILLEWVREQVRP